MALRMFAMIKGVCLTHPCEHMTHTTMWDPSMEEMWYVRSNGDRTGSFLMRADTLMTWITDNPSWKEVTPTDPELELDEGI